MTGNKHNKPLLEFFTLHLLRVYYVYAPNRVFSLVYF